MKDLVVLAADNNIKHALKGLIVSRAAPVLTEASVVFASAHEAGALRPAGRPSHAAHAREERL